MKAQTELSNDPVLNNTEYINELKIKFIRQIQLILLLLSGKLSNALSRKNAAIFLFPFRFLRHCMFILAKCKSFLNQTFCTRTRTEKEVKFNSEVEVKSAYEPSGPSGWCLRRFLYHEATGSILTTSRMGYATEIHFRVLPRTLNSVPIYTPEWRKAPWELSVLPKNTIQGPQPGHKLSLLKIEKKYNNQITGRLHRFLINVKIDDN